MLSLHGVPWTSQTCTAPWEWQLFIPQTLRPGGPQICHRVLTTFFEGWLKHSAGWRLNQHLLLSQTRRWERAQRTEVRSKRRLCANKKFKISGTDKILFAVDLNIYIFKPSSQVVAKECCEMHAEERVGAWCCWEGVSSLRVCKCATECHGYPAKPQPEEELNCRFPTDKLRGD